MSTFFLLVEVLSYGFALFLLLKKKDLAIIYLPVLVFSNNIIVPSISASVYYGTISVLILSCIRSNLAFYRNNIYAVLLFLYFVYLIPGSSNLVLIRPGLFSVLWLFASIPLISAVYRKYTSDVIFGEVVKAAALVLLLFVANVIASTMYRYAPAGMYGITSGILYGNIYAAGFNILAIAVFVTAWKAIESRQSFYIVLLVVSCAFIMLSLRRSVMLISALGVAIAFLTLLAQKEAKKFVVLGSVVCLLGYVIYTNTGFSDTFKERYELRRLDDREMGEEKRFIEYNLIYTDMFIYNRYSPWFGFELMNSAGNYGKSIFDNRTLHADLPSIAHSSGIIGVILYLMMVFTAFRQALRAATSNTTRLIVLFCAVTFVVYSVTGRFTESASMILLFLALALPLAGADVERDDEIEFEFSG